MSTRRLRRRTAEIDDQHQASTAEIDTALAARRRFLTQAAAGGAIAFGATAYPLTAMVSAADAQNAPPVAAFGTTPGTTPGSTPGSTPGTAAGPATTVVPLVEGADLQIVIFLQTVELAAIEMYNRMVSGGRLSPPVTHTAQVYALDHNDHATRLAAVAGSDALNIPNSALYDATLRKIVVAEADLPKAEADLVQIAYDFEDGMAATYAWAMGLIQDWQTAAIAAVIEPVESQHAVAWSTVLVPDTDAWKKQITTFIPNFQNDDAAFRPQQYPAR